MIISESNYSKFYLNQPITMRCNINNGIDSIKYYIDSLNDEELNSIKENIYNINIINDYKILVQSELYSITLQIDNYQKIISVKGRNNSKKYFELIKGLVKKRKKIINYYINYYNAFIFNNETNKSKEIYNYEELMLINTTNTIVVYPESVIKQIDTYINNRIINKVK